MYDRVQELIQWRADLLMAGRSDDLAGEYVFPLAMYLGKTPLVVPDRAQLAMVLDQVCANHRARGVRHLTARVVAMDLPRQGRFRVWASYHEQDVSGRAVGQSTGVLYCRLTEQGIRTEMVDYTRLNDARDWLQTGIRAVARH